MTKKTPRFVRPDGSFDKKAYNHWYYETHKGLLDNSLPNSHDASGRYVPGPHPVMGKSEAQTMIEDSLGKRYYDGMNARNQWAISPKRTKHIPLGYYDVGAYIDNNLQYQSEHIDREFKRKLDTAREAGMSSNEASKLERQFNRSKAMADTERAKLVSQYEELADTYNKVNDYKLKRAAIKNTGRRFVREWQDSFNIGMDQIVGTAKTYANYVKRLLLKLKR